jgi:hypothetical protein
MEGDPAMPGEIFDYTSILMDLEAKKAALDAMIASFRSALAIGALGSVGEVSTAPNAAGPLAAGASENSIELPTGAFHGKSIPAAIKLYLSAVKKKQNNREISSALREGGVESTSPNFEGVITGALNRMKAGGEVLRFKDGWGLAEFYPESLRARISVVSKPVKKKKAKRAAKVKVDRSAEARDLAEKAVAQSEPVPEAGAAAHVPGPQKVILDHVATLEGKRITTDEVAAALGIRKQTVALILAKIAHTGGIDKNPDGSFNVGKVEHPVGMVN